MRDFRRKRILEAYGEKRGGEIANLAEREGYQFDGASKALFVHEDTVWPDGYDIDTVYPLNEDARARPAHVDEPSSWTLFLARSKEVGATTCWLVRSCYEELVLTYLDWGLPKPGAIADLRALREETQRAIEQANNSLERLFSETRCYLAVMFLEAYRRAPEKTQDSVATRFREGTWLYLLTGLDWDLISHKVIEEVEGYFPGTPPEIAQIQSTAIAALLERRDRVIAEVLPVEARRIACENILAKIVRGEEVGRWSKKDEESLLPRREDFKCQSREAKRDIFDLYDALSEGGYREEEWTIHTDIFRVLAKIKAETKSPNTSRSRFIAGEVARLTLMVKRTLEWRSANGFAGDNAVLSGTSEEVAKQVCDWLFEIGCSHKSEWMRKMA